MRIDAVVGDANVLLSAVIGKAALRVFREHEVHVHVTTFNEDEVARYLPRLSARYALPHDLVELNWRLLPRTTHDQDVYREELERARADLADRDPDDAHPLALARTLGLPIWSNNRDLQGQDVARFTTAQLLASLVDPSPPRGRGPRL
jgi:predicted nucleic acid-binding protein